MHKLAAIGRGDDRRYLASRRLCRNHQRCLRPGGRLAAPNVGPSVWAIFAEPIAILLDAVVTVALAWLTPRPAKLLGQEQANKPQAALQAAADRAAGMDILKLSGGRSARRDRSRRWRRTSP
jgi:hypothetical protein